MHSSDALIPKVAGTAKKAALNEFEHRGQIERVHSGVLRDSAVLL